jgi:hypothetical protein
MAGDTQANAVIHLVGSDSRLLCAVAIAVSIMSAFYSFEAGREAALANYWLSRNEAFLEQLSNQGVKVPQDLLHHHEK